MNTVKLIHGYVGNRAIRIVAIAIAVAVFLPALVARAGPCDISWDGDKVAANSRGHSLSAGMRLLDKDKNVSAEVTVAQVMAFYEAKDAISRVVGRMPSFVFCDGKEPNAFAMKGSNGDLVGVTVGMLKLANGDRDMAGAVIGHEYTHLIKNHASEGEVRDLLIDILGIVVGAVIENKTQQRTGVQGLGFNLGQIGATLVSRKFTRDQEREADELGFGYMVSAGFNPNGAIRLAEQMNRVGAGGIGLFFDSHPGWDERNARFRSMIANSAAAQQIIERTGNSTTLLAAQNTVGVQAQIALAPTYEISNSQKSFGDGLVAWRRNDIAVAVRAFRSAANANYAPAQVVVGYFYDTGLGGLPKNDAEAVRLYRLAADQGNAPGQARLGFMYVNGRGSLTKDDAEAVRLFRLAVDQGNAEGQAALGFMYENGSGGLTKDDAEAVRLYRSAADQGNAQGQANLGVMYDSGRGGLAKDDVEAVRLYRLAADQGNTLGQTNLGIMYDSGRGGLAKDDVEAVRLFRLAADQGYAQGQNNLGTMLELKRGGLSKNIEEAVSWYQKAAAQGNADAIANLKRLRKL